MVSISDITQRKYDTICDDIIIIYNIHYSLGIIIIPTHIRANCRHIFSARRLCYTEIIIIGKSVKLCTRLIDL